ncbi:class I SAM-dependent methyltransferase [Paludisphaera rhizosphaerae]|uniref:class I SAM-dependent methyltransferase n=1 Tax=Paludisphaera rhizosphaerae TaxID=2711216 RepID=UPI0013ED8988|nr:class I SAM-dependent methyltransferase [Paludisphaera rhizosphaerae]
MSKEDPIHRAAAEGFAQGAEAYMRGRPDYPAEVVGWLRDRLRLGPEATVVELGAGTGKFTPRLLETGAKVVAVEPVAPMLAKLTAAWPQVEARSGSATSIPLGDESADAVVCAQSFHWFATPEALAEIRRVLKPGGRLGLVWNVKDSRVDWVAKLDRIVERHEGGAPQYRTGAWRRAFPARGFGPLHEDRFPHGHTGPPEVVVLDRVRSTSYIAALPSKERAKVEDEVRALIAEEFPNAERVAVPYETNAFWTEKGE